MSTIAVGSSNKNCIHQFQNIMKAYLIKQRMRIYLLIQRILLILVLVERNFYNKFNCSQNNFSLTESLLHKK